MTGSNWRALAALLALAFVVRLWSGGYLDRDARWRFPATGPRAPVQALFFSGDAGMRFGTGPVVARALAAQGIDTTGFATSTLFRLGTDRAGIDAVVADAVKRAGSDRLILLGQSFGADMLQTGLADLSRTLRRRIAGVVLIVPGTGSYFRADPLGLLYRETADSRSIATARRIDWVPVTCIHGRDERDSLCPLMTMRNVTSVELPGGHYLDHDSPRVAAAVLRAIERR